MAENKPLTFVLSDESINSHGTRIMTAGIDLSMFKNNPIMLWMHNRAWRGQTDEVLPIGRWENVRKDGERLLADAIFDEKDDFVQRIKGKVEQGIISMASIGIDIIATSDDKSVILQGQRYPTIIKCRLNESSLCDIGSNRNALKLYDEFGAELKLSDGGYGHLLPRLNLNQTENPNRMNLLEQITGALKLTGIVDDSALIAHLQLLQSTNQTLTDRVAAYEKADADRHTAAIVSLVDSAIADRKITQSDREHFLTLASAAFEPTEAILSKMPVAVDLSAGIPPSDDHQGDGWEKRQREIDSQKQ